MSVCILPFSKIKAKNTSGAYVRSFVAQLGIVAFPDPLGQKVGLVPVTRVLEDLLTASRGLIRCL